MWYRKFLVIFAVLGLQAPAACTTTGPGDGDGDGIYTWGRVVDFLSAQAVEGVEVCLMDTDNCTDTDSDGAFTIEGLEADTDFLLSFDDNRYFQAVGHDNSARAVEYDWQYSLPTEDAIALQTSLAGESEVERGMGQVFFAAAQEFGHNKPRVAGVSLTPLEGSEALGTPVYGDDLGAPNTSLTETGSSGVVIFPNVEPGVYQFRLSGPDCVPYFSFDTTEDNVYTVHVFANTLSAVTVVCEN